MSGPYNPQLAYEVPVQSGSWPAIPWDPASKPSSSPEIAAKIERFLSLFPRSRFDSSLYEAPISIVTPARPEILTTIDFVQDYPQPESVLKRITTSQESLADYRFGPSGAGWPAHTPFNPVTSRYTGLPVFVAAVVPPFDLTADAAQRQAGEWLESHIQVITGLDSQLLADNLHLAQTQGIPTTDQSADIVHVYYQQRFRDYPVYGAQVALHMAADDNADQQRSTYVTSSFFPIPDIQFEGSNIDPSQAIKDAEQALAALLSGPDALQPLGEMLASHTGQDLSDRLGAYAATRAAALDAKDALVAEFTGADPALRGQGLPELFNRAWNRQEGRISAEPAWWNKPQFPGAILDTAQIGDLLAPPRMNHHDLLDMAPADLQPWLEQPIQDVAAMPFPQLKAFDDARLAAAQALAEVQDWFAKNSVSEENQASLATVIETWAERDETESPLWEAHIASYEGSELMVLPYAGRYYLAYLVELLTPSRDGGWRVFVNAKSDLAEDEARIIGRPEPLGMHFDLRVYPSSQAVLDGINHRVDLTDAEGETIDNDLNPVARFAFHPDAGGGNFTMQELRSAGGLPQSKYGEGMNIAFHAHKMYRFLLDTCRVDPADLLRWHRATGAHGAPLTIQAGMGGTTLTTAFVPSTASFSGTISFQTALAAGLTGEKGKKVHNPSLDPEVIYHEMAHGLMWLLNRVPFDNRQDSVPFGRALLEGYANYLARSLAAPTDPGAGPWARASYRGEVWRQRWSVAVPAVEPSSGHAPSQTEIGLRLLPAPNQYPAVETKGLAVYDVGMIWARALWDIRTYLSQQVDVGDGVTLADYLAIQSYRCVLGWSSSFETAAESLITAARLELSRIVGLSPERQKRIVKDIQDIVMSRGILAERGIQAIGQVISGGATRWLAGADSGLRVSADPKHLWANWQQVVTNGGNALPGVVDLFVAGDQVYIATELGIFCWNAASGAFVADKVGAAELAAETPRCLSMVDGQLVVGTNRTLWRFDNVAQTWQSWAPAGRELKLAASRIVTTTVNGQDFILVAALNHIRYAELNPGAAAAPDWKTIILLNGQNEEVEPGWIMGLCAVGSTLYTATLSHGIWRVQLSINAGSLDARIVPAPMSGSTGMGKVQRLIQAGNSKLYAGTTTGLFEFDLQAGAASWTRVVGSPDAIATVVCHVGGAVAVGTALNGLWIQRPIPGGVEVVEIDTDV